MSQFFTSARRLMISCAVVASIAGCQGDTVETGEVFGVVKLDGQPVEKAVVYFYPDGGGRSSMAETQSDGRYELVYKGQHKGAKIDTHSVTLTTATEDSQDDKGKVIKGKKELFPKEYASEGTIKREVKPGKNEINFDVTTK